MISDFSSLVRFFFYLRDFLTPMSVATVEIFAILCHNCLLDNME